MNMWEVPAPPTATESDFFNAARRTAFLLVEGGSDVRFWEARVDRRRCQVRATGGRKSALQEVEARRAEGKLEFLAVLDADFDRIEGTLAEHPGVVWTDLHDLECLLIHSPALEKVLAEVSSRNKVDNFERTERRTVREALLAASLALGRLRWLSRRRQLGLTFRKRPKDDDAFHYLKYADFCDTTSWQMDIATMVQTVLNFCSRQNLQAQDLLAAMDSLPEADPWQLCVGHDLVGILAIGLRKKLGSRKALSIEDLQERLRLAYEQGHLEATGIYSAIREWEAQNPRFRIFSSTTHARR